MTEQYQTVCLRIERLQYGHQSKDGNKAHIFIIGSKDFWQ